MTCRPIDTAPRDVQVSVLTRARNVRTCWFDADRAPPDTPPDEAMRPKPRHRARRAGGGVAARLLRNSLHTEVREEAARMREKANALVKEAERLEAEDSDR